MIYYRQGAVRRLKRSNKRHRWFDIDMKPEIARRTPPWGPVDSSFKVQKCANCDLYRHMYVYSWERSLRTGFVNDYFIIEDGKKRYYYPQPIPFGCGETRIVSAKPFMLEEELFEINDF